ncbi:homoserine kinase [Leuconostoc citreum]|uniref:homoserine kinase n=1 Tax=Leuconostoc citreum TaxID=33964 RepID=UPI00024664B0|nr:homoserine kinase [Leuconostoc citreum]CCF25660.1 Homoserine kinase [Leuconostoc citreum LBAE C11]
MIKIKVPATSANIGPGFDSLGLALDLFLTLEIHEATTTWQVIHEEPDLPHDITHFIVQAALTLTSNMQPHRLVVKSDIPLARGLGSSSAALLAGLTMANILADLNLSPKEILKQATMLEGHPDNVAPALLGGAVSAYYDGHQVYSSSFHIPENIIFTVFIPDYELKTAEARNALPDDFPFKKSIAGSAISNTLIAALANDDWQTAKQLIEKDQFHEQQRHYLVPHLLEIRHIAHQHDVLGTYLSGAGPTVITMAPENEAKILLPALTHLTTSGRTIQCHLNRSGLTITKEE